MKPTVEIIIRGHVNTGKTRLLYAIKQLLEYHHGLNIEFVGDPDYKNYDQIEQVCQSTIEDVMDALAERQKNNDLRIMIRSEQANRTDYREV